MLLQAFDTILDTDLEIGTSIICLGLSLVYGLILAIIYKYFKRIRLLLIKSILIFWIIVLRMK